MKEEDELVKKINTVSEILEDIYGRFDEIYIEDELDQTLKQLKEKGGKKLTKKQRREQVVSYLDKRFPKLSKQLDEFVMVAEAISIKINNVKDILSDSMDSLDDLKRDKDDFDERLEDLKAW